jgi:hypothetical protein
VIVISIFLSTNYLMRLPGMDLSFMRLSEITWPRFHFSAGSLWSTASFIQHITWPSCNLWAVLYDITAGCLQITNTCVMWKNEDDQLQGPLYSSYAIVHEQYRCCAVAGDHGNFLNLWYRHLHTQFSNCYTSCASTLACSDTLYFSCISWARISVAFLIVMNCIAQPG